MKKTGVVILVFLLGIRTFAAEYNFYFYDREATPDLAKDGKAIKSEVKEDEQREIQEAKQTPTTSSYFLANPKNFASFGAGYEWVGSAYSESVLTLGLKILPYITLEGAAGTHQPYDLWRVWEYFDVKKSVRASALLDFHLVEKLQAHIGMGGFRTEEIDTIPYAAAGLKWSGLKIFNITATYMALLPADSVSKDNFSSEGMRTLRKARADMFSVGISFNFL